MKKHIFITGGGGYIGSKMVATYLKKGYFVSALDRYFFGDVLSDLKANKSLRILKDDTRKFNKMYLENVDTVIDMAAISSEKASEINPKLTYEINCDGAIRVATLAKKMGVKRYIFSSTCNVYGGGSKLHDETSEIFPIGIYAKSKARAEKKLLKLADDDFTVTIMRNAPVYGLSERRMRFDLVVNIMTLQALRDNKIHILGGGKQSRPLVHIDDLIRAFLYVAEEKNPSKIHKQIFNVGSGKQIFQMYQVAKKIKQHFPNVEIENVDGPIDKISYKVNFDRIGRVLKFKAEKTIDEGIDELRKALEKGIVEDVVKTRIYEFFNSRISKGKKI